MTWLGSVKSFIGAEENDMDLAVQGTAAGTTDVISATSRPVSGDRNYELPMNANAKLAYLPLVGPAANNLFALPMQWGLSGLPSGEFAMVSNGVQRGTANFEGPLRCDATGHVAFFDSGGNRLSPWSATTLPTAGMMGVVPIWDFLSTSTSDLATAYLVLFMNGALEMMGFADTRGAGTKILNDAAAHGGVVGVGEKLPAGSNYGITAYLDDCVALVSTTLADAPWAAAMPIPRVFGGAKRPPILAGDLSEWDAGHANVAASAYLDLDEYPHDGTTASTGTYINTTGASKRALFRLGPTNPLDSSYTVMFYLPRGAICLGSGGKLAADFIVRDSRQNERDAFNNVSPSTTFVGSGGALVQTLNPAGSAASYTDFDQLKGTATASDTVSFTDSGANWATNGLANAVVTMGGKTMTVVSNTATKVTGAGWSGGGTPTFGAYTFNVSALQIGVLSQTVSAGSQISNICLDVVAYNATLPLTRRPVELDRRFVRGAMRGTLRGAA